MEKPKLKTRIWNFLKKTSKKLAIVGVSLLVGAAIPTAGAALCQFLKLKLLNIPFELNIPDEVLNNLCTEAITKQSLEYLSDKLKEKIREKNENLTEIEIASILNSSLLPIYDSIDDLKNKLSEIKGNFDDKVNDLVKAWGYENEQFLEEQGKQLENFLNTVSNQLNSISKTLIDKFSSEFETLNNKLDAMATSIIDIQKKTNQKQSINYFILTNTIFTLNLYKNNVLVHLGSVSSTYDIPFDPELYIERSETKIFKDYLTDVKTYYPSSRILFLIFGSPGMGKTWLLSHWFDLIMKNEYMENNNENNQIKFLPFFLTLNKDIEIQFQLYFGTDSPSDIRDRLKNINTNNKIRPILFIDGLEEVSDEKIEKILDFIIMMLNDKVPVILSCRDSDWNFRPPIIKKRKRLKKDFIYSKPIFLYKFNDNEFKNALKSYGLILALFKNSETVNMAKRPVILRLFSEYYLRNNEIPDANNPKNFKLIFLGQTGDCPETHILGRFNIIGLTRSILFNIIKKFIDSKSPILGFSDLESYTSEKEFQVILSSGMILSISVDVGVKYIINRLFEPHLLYCIKDVYNIQFDYNEDYIKKYLDIAKYYNTFYTTNKKVKDLLEAKSYYEKVINLKSYIKNKLLLTDVKNQLGEIQLELEQIAKSDLERLLTKEIPNIKINEWNPIGIVKTGNNITGLRLCRCELGGLPESFGFLEFLQTLDLRYNQLKNLPESFGSLNSLQELSLWGNQLKNLPESFGNLQSLQTLNLGHNELRNLLEPILELKNLQVLSLGDNELTDLPESFGNLQSLQTLNLGHNELKNLPEPILELKNLQVLNLRANKLTDLPEPILELKNLQVLNLWANKLTDLPESFGNLQSLQTLDLVDNKLTDLPESFGNLQSLQTLNLGHNEIKNLPEPILELKNLQVLNLRANKLTDLPESFGSLKSLQKLDLESNQLTTLPELFGSLKSLQKLDLEDNQLKNLPESFGSLNSLQELSLWGNQLKNLPEPILELKNLQVLNLRGNKLTALPESFGNLNSLQILYLNDNKLTTLPESFGSLKSLQKLDLRDNQLKNLPESFGNLNSLQILYLNDNKLKNLPEPILELKNLQVLNLRGNELTDLPESFGSLKSLQKLWLYNNELKNLPEPILELKNLQVISLGGNELTDLPESLCSMPNLKHIYITMRLLGNQAKLVINRCKKKGIIIYNW
ncbi:MAG: leucine-rich repeat domain-containing protein [Candidatus Helarchaeota archaeon]